MSKSGIRFIIIVKRANETSLTFIARDYTIDSLEYIASASGLYTVINKPLAYLYIDTVIEENILGKTLIGFSLINIV